jgi:hypothetical protein
MRRCGRVKSSSEQRHKLNLKAKLKQIDSRRSYFSSERVFLGLSARV